MHEHDPDLIAALADGSLDDETEARALIESCDQCLSEYQDQVEVLALLVATPTARMNDLERAALHRDIWTELRKSPSRTGITPWWVRWSYVAAGLFVTVGLVSVLNGQFLTFGGDSAGEAFSEIGSGLDDSGGEQAPLTAADADGGAESATTTAAAEEAALPYPFADLADEARANRDLAEDRSSQFSTEAGEVEECLELSGLADQVLVEELDLDRRYLVMMPESETGDLTVTFVALDDCEIVYVDG